MQKEVLTQRARLRFWHVRHWRTLGLALLLLLLIGVTLSNYGAPLLWPRTPLQTSQLVLSSRQGLLPPALCRDASCILPAGQIVGPSNVGTYQMCGLCLLHAGRF